VWPGPDKTVEFCVGKGSAKWKQALPGRVVDFCRVGELRARCTRGWDNALPRRELFDPQAAGLRTGMTRAPAD